MNISDPEIQLKLLMLGCWLYLMYKTLPDFILSLKSKRWTKTNAVVTTSSIDREGNFYRPKLIYKYTVNNKRYINDTYSYLGQASFSKSSAVSIAQSIPEGSSIDIYVNITNPQQAVVVPGVHWLQYASLLILTIFFVAVAYIGPILNFIWPGCEPNCT